MSKLLPRLRQTLDLFPSADGRRPGILIRDPLGYAESVLSVPQEWVIGLGCLDGQHTLLDAQEALTRARGTLVFSDAVRDFVGVLQRNGFLETEEYHRLRDQRHREFQEQAERRAAHAGAAYPADPSELRKTLDEWLGGAASLANDPPNGIVGVAAPHVSPEGGQKCYAATYGRLSALPALRDRIFVILGTSHWGAPGRFGLTCKPFSTPFGRLQVETELVDLLLRKGGKTVIREDYCHAFEHSIEFQCVFLQHVFGPDLKILPILCGPLAEDPDNEAPADSTPELFFAALAELATSLRDRLFWVLGIDLAHIGRRYGDPFSAIAERGQMLEVADRDRDRLEMICRGEGRKFREALRMRDQLQWCGASALYPFLRSLDGVRGRQLGYEQWNIDPESVVTFTSLEFFLP
jgi:AmmeMemoRadiSam system protein B